MKNSTRMGCGEQLLPHLTLLTHVGLVVQTNLPFTEVGRDPHTFSSEASAHLCSSTGLGAPRALAWDKHSLSQQSPGQQPALPHSPTCPRAHTDAVGRL